MQPKPYEFVPPDWSETRYSHARPVRTAPCEQAGVAPDSFYLTSHFPTYYRLESGWVLPPTSSLNCVAVVSDVPEEPSVQIVELRDLKPGQRVVLSQADNTQPNDLVAEGILLYPQGFGPEVCSETGRAVEASLSSKYQLLTERMKQERDNGGHIVWVLGPSVVFDHDTRIALTELAQAGYVHALLAGNALATHDLEGGYLGTALGQNIYTQESQPMGHYNHLDLLNAVRTTGSTKEFVESGKVRNGFMKTLVEQQIPYVLAGSIRDDGPLPEVHACVTESLKAMKAETDRATLIICLATLLHSAATANLASSYRVCEDGSVRPVFFFVVDVTENVANKISAAREHIATRSFITNVQDFVVKLNRRLLHAKEDSSHAV